MWYLNVKEHVKPDFALRQGLVHGIHANGCVLVYGNGIYRLIRMADAVPDFFIRTVSKLVYLSSDYGDKKFPAEEQFFAETVGPGLGVRIDDYLG